MNEALNALLETKIIDTKFLEENLKIEFCKNNENEKFININTNINIPEEMEYQFVIYYLDKKNNKKNCINTNKKNFEIEKYWDIIKYEFKLNGEIILSSEEIKIDVNK